VHALLRLWQEQHLAPGTVKNRLAAVRWWAEKIGRPQVLQADNAVYGVPARQYVATVSKARVLEPEKLTAIRDPYVAVSLELQRAFGLRRDEALKIRPRQADHGDRLVLQGSWTKGGKAREIPIRTAAQRAVLEYAKVVARAGSLIPPTRRSIQQQRVYEYETARVGLTHMHGLRHAYAQERYQELTGWAAPAAGGPTSVQLTPAQRARDLEARLVISAELGHGRERITTAYLGR
jgi:integrase